MYSRQVLDHFVHPRNSGVLDSPDATVQLENPACGDVLQLAGIISAGRISELKFRAKGCVPAIACASALTELVRGKTPTEAAAVRREELVQVLGALPEASTHASHLAMEALAALLTALQAK